MIDSDEKRIKALKLYPIDEVWGIGRRYAARLEALGVKTAYDFAEHNQTWVKATFNNIVIERTWRELNGEDCVPNEEMAKKKSICTSRSFNGMITDIDGINKVNGTETIVLGSQQYTQKDGKGKANVFANAIKHDFKSKNPTTRWSDIIVLK
jgi:nucleotidyltransferase/DNA polymerase involved in DNA repair